MNRRVYLHDGERVLQGTTKEYVQQLKKKGVKVSMCNIAQALLDEGYVKAFIELAQDGVLTIDDAAKRAGLSVEEFEKKMEEYKE